MSGFDLALALAGAAAVGGVQCGIWCLAWHRGRKVGESKSDVRRVQTTFSAMSAASYWQDRAELAEHKIGMIRDRAKLLIDNGRSKDLPRFILAVQRYLPDAYAARRREQRKHMGRAAPEEPEMTSQVPPNIT